MTAVSRHSFGFFNRIGPEADVMLPATNFSKADALTPQFSGRAPRYPARGKRRIK